MAFLHGVDLMSPSPINPSIPMIAFYRVSDDVCDHHTGAHHRRVRQSGYVQIVSYFSDGLADLVYFPFVHMIWGGGIFSAMGRAGFPRAELWVHNIAGMAALASVLLVGRRKVKDSGPHSIPLVALGTGLLWFGWYGFNAEGSEFRVDGVTGQRIPEYRSLPPASPQ